MALHPYLNFGGNCREAFTRYQEIFGGELDIMSFSDMPADEDFEVTSEMKNLVMHAALKFDDQLLMASDDPSPGFGPVQGMSVNYTTSDADEAKRVFTALAEGGETSMPLEPTFWSPIFGACTDRFGTPWMVNAEPTEG